MLGQFEKALRMRRDIYSERLKRSGEEHEETLRSANNYVVSLENLSRFEEAKSVLRKTMPVVRRVLGENDETTLKMRWNYGDALYKDDGATLADLREAVTTLEELAPYARRVLGGAHPTTAGIGRALERSRAVLRAREGTA